MSLNRSEQRIFDYIQSQVDERHFWKEKVQKTSRASGDGQQAARQIEAELWSYYLERSAVVPALRDLARAEGTQRTSMQNLAELFLRLWIEPKPRKNPSAN